MGSTSVRMTDNQLRIILEFLFGVVLYLFPSPIERSKHGFRGINDRKRDDSKEEACDKGSSTKED